METERQNTILYLITKSNWGGAQRYVYDLAVAAQKKHYHVVVAFGGSGILDTRLKESGITTHTLAQLERDIRFFGDLRSFFEIYRLIRTLSPDVIHVNSSKMGGLGALAGRLANLTAHIERLVRRPSRLAHIVFTGHGWTFNEDRSDIARIIIGILHFATIQLAHTTIAVSRRTRNQVITLPFVWHKVGVIHNGIDDISLTSRKNAEHTLDIKHDGTLRVGMIAELHPNKGLDYAIEAFALIHKERPDAQIALSIIGDGEQRAKLEDKIHKLGLEHMVTLHGYHDQASTLLSAFDIFLLSSITEAFPYVILEAGKAGLPVVSTAVGGVPEVIDDMKSGILIQPKNPGEIARALLYLLDHPEQREAFRQTLSARIRDRFSLEHMTKLTFLAYDKRLGQINKDDT
jgi:glycosyltransferase involved in cell wall biosynthesis